MYYDFWYFQSIEYEDVHDKASKGVQGEGAVKFSIHIEEDDEWNHKYRVFLLTGPAPKSSKCRIT